MAPHTSQTVLILGGGIGGIATANRLRRRTDRRHRVVLISRDPANARTFDADVCDYPGRKPNPAAPSLQPTV